MMVRRLVVATLVVLLGACGGGPRIDAGLDEPVASAARVAGSVRIDLERSTALVAAAEAALAHQATAGAGHLLDHATRSALRVDAPRLRSRALGEIARVYARHGDAGAAAGVLERTNPTADHSHNAVVDVVEILVGRGEREAAEDILAAALRRVRTQEAPEVATGLRMLAAAHLHLGERTQALDLLEEAYAITRWRTEAALTGAERGWIAIRFADAGVPDRSRQVVRQVEPLSARVNYLLWLGRALIRNGAIEHAVALLDAFDVVSEDTATTNRLAVMRQHLAKDIAVALARAGKIDEAMMQMNAVTARSIRAEGFAVLAAQAGMHPDHAHRAPHLRADAVDLALSMRPYPAALRLVDIARAAEEAGDVVEARNLLQMANSSASGVTVYRERNEIASRLARVHRALEDLDGMRRAADGLPARSTARERILMDLVTAQAMHGEIGDALETAQALYYEWNTARALAAIVGAYAAAGRPATPGEVAAIAALERKVYWRTVRQTVLGWLSFSF